MNRLISALVVWALTTITLLPSTGTASSLLISGSICHPNDGSATGVSSGALNRSSSMTATCALPSGTEIHHDTVNFLNVSVIDGNDSAGTTAIACVRNPSASTVDCGTSDTSSAGFVGYDALAPDLTDWNNGSYSGWYAYIEVSLPANDITGSGTGNSYLLGYYASQP